MLNGDHSRCLDQESSTVLPLALFVMCSYWKICYFTMPGSTFSLIDTMLKRSTMLNRTAVYETIHTWLIKYQMMHSSFSSACIGHLGRNANSNVKCDKIGSRSHPHNGKAFWKNTLTLSSSGRIFHAYPTSCLWKPSRRTLSWILLYLCGGYTTVCFLYTT